MDRLPDELWVERGGRGCRNPHPSIERPRADREDGKDEQGAEDGLHDLDARATAQELLGCRQQVRMKRGIENQSRAQRVEADIGRGQLAGGGDPRQLVADQAGRRLDDEPAEPDHEAGQEKKGRQAPASQRVPRHGKSRDAAGATDGCRAGGSAWGLAFGIGSSSVTGWRADYAGWAAVVNGDPHGDPRCARPREGYGAPAPAIG